MCDLTHSDSSHSALNSEPLLYVWRGLTEWLICMGWLRLVASIKLQVSFAKYSLFYRALLAKETYNFIEPTNRSHPICMPCLTRMCDMTHSYAWQDLHSSGVCPSIKHHQFSLYTYTHTHTNKFSLTQTNTHTQTHTHWPTQTHTRINTHTHTHISPCSPPLTFPLFLPAPPLACRFEFNGSRRWCGGKRGNWKGGMKYEK